MIFSGIYFPELPNCCWLQLGTWSTSDFWVPLLWVLDSTSKCLLGTCCWSPQRCYWAHGIVFWVPVLYKGSGFEYQVLAGQMLLVYTLQSCYWAHGIVFWVLCFFTRVLDSTASACWACAAGIHATARLLGSWSRFLGAYASKGFWIRQVLAAGQALLVYATVLYWALGIDFWVRVLDSKCRLGMCCWHMLRSFHDSSCPLEVPKRRE